MVAVRDEPTAQKSRRVLGRTPAMLLTAAMIIGTGLFAAPGEASEKAGSGLLLPIFLSGLVALTTGLSAASVGINFPEEGGALSWSRKFGYNTVGFVAGCAYLGKGIVSTVVISLAFAIYTAEVVGGLPSYAVHVVACVAVLLVAAVNYLGVELNAKLLIFLLFVQLALLGIFVGFAAPAVQVENFVPVLGDNGVFGVLAGGGGLLLELGRFPAHGHHGLGGQGAPTDHPVRHRRRYRVLRRRLSGRPGGRTRRPWGRGDERRRGPQRYPARDRGYAGHWAVGGVD